MSKFVGRHLLLLTTAVVAIPSFGCSEGRDPAPGRVAEQPERSGRKGSPGASPRDAREGTRARGRTRARPVPARVRILPLSPTDRRNVRRAVRDLKGLKVWDDLTDHIDFIRISTRPGVERIPLDGHLADSLFTGLVRPGRDGSLCDVYMYSEAIARDVDNQQTLYAYGRLSAPPPTLRQFWAVVLAHEVAHCSQRGQQGELRSNRWERRVLDAYGVDRAGS